MHNRLVRDLHSQLLDEPLLAAIVLPLCFNLHGTLALRAFNYELQVGSSTQMVHVALHRVLRWQSQHLTHPRGDRLVTRALDIVTDPLPYLRVLSQCEHCALEERRAADGRFRRHL